MYVHADGTRSPGKNVISAEGLIQCVTLLTKTPHGRYTRPAGQPRAAERKLMRLVEENLALLVAAQVSHPDEYL